MTFSIIGRSPWGDEFGMAISSSSPAVAARCSHARARVGVVASQNITDPRLGNRILARLAQGESADRALEAVLAASSERDFRQVLALGISGPGAAYSGSRSLGVFDTALDRDCAAESTGHGTPMPQLVHGGPGRAGGGEELGGMRAVKHFMQRTALEGSPAVITRLVGGC